MSFGSHHSQGQDVLYEMETYQSKLSTLFKHSNSKSSFPNNNFNDTFWRGSSRYPIVYPPGGVGIGSSNRIPLDENENTIFSGGNNGLFPILDPNKEDFRPSWASTAPPTTTTITTTTAIPVMFTSGPEEPEITLDLDGNISVGGGRDETVNLHPTTPPTPEVGEGDTKGWTNITSVINEIWSNHTPSTTTPTTTERIFINDVPPEIYAPSSTTSIISQNNVTEATTTAFPAITTPTTSIPVLESQFPQVATPDLLIVYGVFVVLLGILGVLTNSSTIHVLLKDRLSLDIRKHYTNMTILSLAGVNLLASLFSGVGGGGNILRIGFGGLEIYRGGGSTIVVPGGIPRTISPPLALPVSPQVSTTSLAALVANFANVSFAEIEETPPVKGGSNNSETPTPLLVGVDQLFPSRRRGNNSKTNRNQRLTASRESSGESETPGTFTFCKIQCFFSNMASFVSVWTLAVISADRFFAHQWPQKYNGRITLRKFAILNVSIWLQAILFASFSIELWSKDDLLEKGVHSGFCMCTTNWLYIPKQASPELAFFKLLAHIWMTVFPYTVILGFTSFQLYRILFLQKRTQTGVIVMGGQGEGGGPPVFQMNHQLFRINEGGETNEPVNPINRFFMSNPQQQDPQHTVWMSRVLPPPPPPPTQPQQDNPQFQDRENPFSRFQQIREQWDQDEEEAIIESVLNCYIAVILAYFWLQSIPSSVSFLVFLGTGSQGGGDSLLLLMEMMAYLFKLIGFSVNALIYFSLREDFHDAFVDLVDEGCNCWSGGRNRTGPGRGVPTDAWD